MGVSSKLGSLWTSLYPIFTCIPGFHTFRHKMNQFGFSADWKYACILEHMWFFTVLKVDIALFFSFFFFVAPFIGFVGFGGLFWIFSNLLGMLRSVRSIWRQALTPQRGKYSHLCDPWYTGDDISAPTPAWIWCCGRPQKLSSPAVSNRQQRPGASPAVAPAATEPTTRRSPRQPAVRSPWWPPVLPLSTLSAHHSKSKLVPFC